MPRTAGITYDDVRAVCDRLAATGRKPSFAAIKAGLGGRGSYGVLRRHLEAWLRAAGDPERPTAARRDSEDLERWRERVRREAEEAARRSLEPERVRFAGEAARLQAACERLKQEATHARVIQQHQASEWSIALLQVSQLSEANGRLKEAQAAAERVAAEAVTRAEGLTKQLADLQAQHSAALEHHRRQLELADERARGIERALLLRHDAELNQYRERAARLQKDFEDMKVLKEGFERRANDERASHAKTLGLHEAAIAQHARDHKRLNELIAKLERFGN